MSRRSRVVQSLAVVALGVVVVAAAGWALTRDNQAATTRFDDAFCRAAAADPESLDAFDWLKDPYGGPKRLGPLSTDDGLALAHRLLAAGATRVVAAKVHTAKGREPYQYAEGLVVTLPDGPARRGVFEIYATYVRHEDYVPQADRGQSLLYLPCREPNPTALAEAR